MTVQSALVLVLFAAIICSASSSPSSGNSTASSAVGINYGQVADNLPPPETVIPLLRSLGAARVKLYDTEPTVLSAFVGTGVEFIVGLPDRLLPRLAASPSQALAWIKSNLQPHLPATRIVAVTVGNEVLSGNDTDMMDALVPAMTALHSALVSLGLDRRVTVTTAHSLAVLSTSYPPSAATFRRDLLPYVAPLLAFLSKTGSPFLINAYPYFAYKADPKRVNLDYVLFEPNAGVVDPGSGLRYENMLHAQVDAVRTAIAGSGVKGVEVRVSETGWPSAGDSDEAGATPENAKRYNGNLLRMVAEGRGTPAAPDEPLQVYVFALFNENQKPGPASERHYGLFKPDGTPAYDLDGLSPAPIGNVSEGGGDDGVESAESPEGQAKASATGFLWISSATEGWNWRQKILTVVMANLVILASYCY